MFDYAYVNNYTTDKEEKQDTNGKKYRKKYQTCIC